MRAGGTSLRHVLFRWGFDWLRSWPARAALSTGSWAPPREYALLCVFALWRGRAHSTAGKPGHRAALARFLFSLRRAWLMRRRALPLQGRKSAAPFRAVALLLRAITQGKSAGKFPHAEFCALILRPPRGPAPGAGCSFSRAGSSWVLVRRHRSSTPSWRARPSR